MAVDTLSGLDVLETPVAPAVGRWRRVWAATWPKLLAITIVLATWQAVVWSGVKDPWVLPSPREVFGSLGSSLTDSHVWRALGNTLRRGVVGFAWATAFGLVLGLAIARFKVLRAAIGSLITGLQTMPSIAWFPWAILLFQLSEEAILFVIVIGAAPSIANGVISGVDYVPPLLLRAGRNLGARGVSLYRFVIAPAALPAVVAGLKQGWAFAWRSLMAGELLVRIPDKPSLGGRMHDAWDLNNASGLVAEMIVILMIGIGADALFGAADRTIRRRWGLTE